MRFVKKITHVLLVSTFAASLIFATSCTRRPNEEQIKKLEETRAAALSAEQKLEQKRQERQTLEQQLNQKKQELDKVKKQKEDVQKRLQNWKSE